MRLCQIQSDSEQSTEGQSGADGAVEVPQDAFLARPEVPEPLAAGHLLPALPLRLRRGARRAWAALPEAPLLQLLDGALAVALVTAVAFATSLLLRSRSSRARPPPFLLRSGNPPSGPKSCCHSGFQVNAVAASCIRLTAMHALSIYDHRHFCRSSSASVHGSHRRALRGALITPHGQHRYVTMTMRENPFETCEGPRCVTVHFRAHQ